MKISNFKNRSASAHPGFTLTELLVVVLVIVILAAMAFLGTQRVRLMADKATSTRNISQIQIANTSYATDHNGNCVPFLENNSSGQRIAWWYQNPEFLKNLIGEVLDKSGNQVAAAPPSYLDPKVYRARKALYTSMAASYGMNDNGVSGSSEPNAAPCHNLNQIPDPSRSMAFATATDVRVNYNSRFSWKEADSKTSDGAIAYRYGDKALVVFFDSHVEEVGKADMRQIDTRGGKNNVFWNPKAK